MQEGAWAEGVGTALEKLGCRILDSQALGLDSPQQIKGGVVHMPTGPGVCEALSSQFGAVPQPGVNWLGAPLGLSADEGRQLRAFFLQVPPPPQRISPATQSFWRPPEKRVHSMLLANSGMLPIYDCSCSNGAAG